MFCAKLTINNNINGCCDYCTHVMQEILTFCFADVILLFFYKPIT